MLFSLDSIGCLCGADAADRRFDALSKDSDKLLDGTQAYVAMTPPIDALALDSSGFLWIPLDSCGFLSGFLWIPLWIHEDSSLDLSIKHI